MKKARLLMAAIGVFTIVGGTLAFKAQRGSFLYCTAELGTKGTLLTNWTITASSPGLTATCTTNPDDVINATTLITPQL